MASAAQDFYEAARDAFLAVDGSALHWDAVPIRQDEPWFNLIKVTDPEESTLFCPYIEGDILFQFDGYGKDRWDLYDQMEAFHRVIRDIRGVIGTSYFWRNRTSGVRSLGEAAEGYHHYIFETQIQWEENT